MLCLTLNHGDYMTIGSDVVVQLDRVKGDRCRLVIHAPREIPVVRGELLERDGRERPDFLYDAPVCHKRELMWDRSKAEALSAMRELLSKMDGRDGNVQTLRRQLNHMFPPGTRRFYEVSNG